MISLSFLFGAEDRYFPSAASHNLGQLISPVAELKDDDFLVEYYVQEAKRYYADARLMAVLGDSLGVQFEVERMVAALAAIEELDVPIPEELSELVRGLSELAASDFRSYISPELQNLLGQPSFKEQLWKMSELLDSLDSDTKFIVVDDRDGHLPLILNKRVETMINFLKDRRHAEFQLWLDRYSRYATTIQPILASYGLPEELIFLALIESGLNPKAYSYAHAVGPWQFIYSTGKRYQLDRDWWIDERRDIVKSTHAAAQYLRDLYNEFDDWYLAMAAYNSGEMHIRRAIRREGHRDYWRMISLPRQTRNYVATVLSAAIIAGDPEAYQFEIKEFTNWEYDIIEVDRSLDLDKIARVLKVQYGTLKDLNPELRQGVTPPQDTAYQLRVPTGKGDISSTQIAAIPTSEKKEFQLHYVRRGETLSSIAARYHVSVSQLVRANHIKNKNRLAVGQKLVIPTTAYYTSSASKKSTTAASMPAGDYNKIIYTVKKGDTLGHIAERYRTRASRIRYWNGLRYGQHIYPGQKLTIYTPKTNG